MNCSLCFGKAEYFFADKKRSYARCVSCCAVLVPSEYFISEAAEKARYDFHNNDSKNEGYLKYIQPIVSEVLNSYSPAALGLDFGSGPNSGVSFLLKNAGFMVDSYDPFFDNNQSKLQQKYDYVIACEVIEHFKQPAKEFELLSSLLKPNGKLILMTRIFTHEIDFSAWFYKNDATHVFFYAPETFEKIADTFNFNLIKIENRLIVFENK